MSDVAFPPERHVLRDIGFTGEVTDDGRYVAVVPGSDDLQGRTGLPSIGPLGVVVDSVATMAVLPAIQPDWTATANLAIHLTGEPAAANLVVEAEILRAGSRLVVVRTVVTDGGDVDADALLDGLSASVDARATGRRLAVGTLSFVRMPSSRSVAALGPAPARARTTRTRPSTMDPIADRVGLEVHDEPGVVAIPSSEYVRNSMGAISGGVHVIGAQAAAEALLPHLGATDVEVHFLAAARVGPIRATATAVRDHAGHATATVEVVDQGTDTLVSTASVSLRA